MPNRYTVTVDGRTFSRSSDRTYTHAVVTTTVAGAVFASFHGTESAAEKEARRMRAVRFDNSLHVRGGGALVNASAVVLPVVAEGR